MALTEVPIELSSAPGIVDNSTGTAITIDASSNVGIGTDLPLQALHVNSGTGNSAAIFESTDSTSQIWLKDSASSTTYQTGIACFGDNLLFNNGGEKMRIDASGNVGIGTSSPTRELEVTGSGNVYIKVTAPTATDSAGLELANTGATWLIQNDDTSSDALTFDRAGTEAMRIDSSGNVGIGTDSPSNTANYATLELSGATGSIVNLTDDGVRVGSFFNTVNDVSIGNFTATGFFGFRTNSTERMRIDSSGNVGIGVVPENSSGTWRNFEQGGLNLAGRSAGDVDGMVGTNYVFKTDNSEVYKYTGATSRLFFDANEIKFQQAASGTAGTAISWSEAMRIDSSGLVGIGTDSPATVLSIHDSADKASLTQTNTANTQKLEIGNAFSLYSGASGSVSAIASDAVLAFATADAEAMRIDASGNLLVNTSTVNGKINFQGDGTSTAYTLVCTDSAGNGTLQVRDDGLINTGTTTSSPYNLTTASAANVHVLSNGTLYRSTSSERYKNTIQNATHGLTELLTLRPVTYKGNDDGDLVFGGLIAEEVHDAGLTEFVQYNEENQPDALAYGNMVSLCIKAIQEQQDLIQSLRARVAQLEGAN